jgi:L-2-hydroxyglutarate oxidase LhgO
LTQTVDCLVVGAGVVGLAAACALARAGREVVVVEAADTIGSGVSSRSSEVIHAGLYYAAGSLKARLCVEGRARLYDFCAERGVAHRRCGKLVVAAEATQQPDLARIAAAARANGVDDLQQLTGAQAGTLEPALRCSAALLSTSTGIVDSHGLMLALLGDAQDHGAVLALRSPVERGCAVAGGIELDIGGAEPMRVVARSVVNAAGLQATALAAAIDGMPPERIPLARLCKGSYFTLQGRAPFARLVYPLPDEAGLGTHLTLDLGGQARFGPDVEWVDALDYRVDPRCADVFYAQVRRWWPGLRDGALQPAYSGIRPKVVGPGEPAADFVVDGPAVHGVDGLVNLFGIESPGLTASLALADEVVRRLQ